MPEDLYTADALKWSEQQAARLARMARGEAVNEPIDWPHVIEEVADVGLAELRSCESYLRLAMQHLMKIHCWPDGPVEHWSVELGNFLTEAQSRFTPSMRQRIDLAKLYAKSRRLVGRATVDGVPPGPLPETCPFALDELIADDWDIDQLIVKLKK